MMTKADRDRMREVANMEPSPIDYHSGHILDLLNELDAKDNEIETLKVRLEVSQWHYTKD